MRFFSNWPSNLQPPFHSYLFQELSNSSLELCRGYVTPFSHNWPCNLRFPPREISILQALQTRHTSSLFTHLLPPFPTPVLPSFGMTCFPAFCFPSEPTPCCLCFNLPSHAWTSSPSSSRLQVLFLKLLSS